MSAPRDASAVPDLQPDAAAPTSVQDRLYEWSTELPAWQRDLLRRLAAGPLSSDEEADVLKILLGSEGAPSPQPLERADLLPDEGTTGPVELREIRDVQNVNLLAEGQALQFKPGINVVFGATGAGKSGYGRLLRRLCRPGERVELLPNAFDANAEGKRQTAVVEIEVGGAPREMAIDLATDPDRVLSAMSIFDAARAPAHMSKPSVIEHVPKPLLLLRSLAEAQEALQSRLKKRLAALQDALSPPETTPGTPVNRVVEAITAETDVDELRRHATLSDEEEAELRRLDSALSVIRTGDGREQERAARARARAAERVAEELEDASERLASDTLAAIADLRARHDEAVAAERSLAADAFSGKMHPGTGQEPWRRMWEAARRFVESEDGAFPGDDPSSTCPLCQQALGEDALGRLAKLEGFVRSDLRERVSSLAEELSRAARRIPDVALLEKLVDASLSGGPEQLTASAAGVLDSLSARAELARRLTSDAAGARTAGEAKAQTEGLSSAPPVPPVTPIRAYASEQVSAAETHASLRDETAQQRLIDRRTALRGRAELAAALPAISEHIDALREIDAHRRASVELRTQKVSGQLRKLQEDAVTGRLRAAIVEELKALDLLAAEIDVAGKARGGRAAVEFALRGAVDVKVGAVLSEGEQRALALAFFLAESAVGRGRSAIVLDDPAALLDRERCSYVARRLVEEARQRQVIVFTHDIAFAQMLRRSAADAGQELHSQAIRRAYGRAGMLGEGHGASTVAPASPT